MPTDHSRLWWAQPTLHFLGKASPPQKTPKERRGSVRLRFSTACQFVQPALRGVGINLPNPSTLPYMRLCAYFSTPPKSLRAVCRRRFRFAAGDLRRHFSEDSQIPCRHLHSQKTAEGSRAQRDAFNSRHMRFYAVIMRMMRFVLFLVSVRQPVRICAPRQDFRHGRTNDERPMGTDEHG